jgi:hypothetical protein
MRHQGSYREPRWCPPQMGSHPDGNLWLLQEVRRDQEGEEGDDR